MISGNDLLKGGVIVTLHLVGVGFGRSANQADDRRYLICGILASLVAVLIARGLAIMLPFRPRPMTCGGIHFQTPFGSSDGGLIDWSSFPSDHAAVFLALATSISFVWRAAGIAALFYVFLFIAMPRLYLGFHYATCTLLGGALHRSIIMSRAESPLPSSTPCAFRVCVRGCEEFQTPSKRGNGERHGSLRLFFRKWEGTAAPPRRNPVG